MCADLIIEPYGALIVGGLTGIISTLGFKFCTVSKSSAEETSDCITISLMFLGIAFDGKKNEDS